MCDIDASNINNPETEKLVKEQCAGITKTGTRCLLTVRNGFYCHHHVNQEKSTFAEAPMCDIDASNINNPETEKLVKEQCAGFLM